MLIYHFIDIYQDHLIFIKIPNIILILLNFDIICHIYLILFLNSLNHLFIMLINNLFNF